MLDRLSEIVFPTARTPRRWTRLPGGIGRLPSHPRYRAALETRQARVIAQLPRRACD